MNTNSYFTAALATEIIDSRVREARNARLVSEVRETDRTPGSDTPKSVVRRTARRWFSRPATA